MEYFRPDLLITDIRMPEKDGLSLIEMAEKRGLCSRCIILTAYESFEYAKRALDYHVIGYLVKPIDWIALDARLFAVAQELHGKQDTQQTLAKYSHLFRHLSQQDGSPTMRKIQRYIQKTFKRSYPWRSCPSIPVFRKATCAHCSKMKWI